MELSGYLFRNILKKTRRRFSLNAGEQALYQELVDICNEENWSQSFQVSNGELTTALNCNEKTLAGWRQSLINAGLIIYNSGKSKRSFGSYSLVVETTVKITTNPTTNPTTNLTTNPTTNPSDYIQLKETKQEEIKSKPKSKIFVPPTISEVEVYFNDNGYSVLAARKAFAYYSAGNWKDSNGKQVKNWKQKMQGVWFKPENLIAKQTQISMY